VKRLFIVGVSLVSSSLLAAESGAGAHDAHEAHVANWWGLGAEHAHEPALGLVTMTFLIFTSALLWILRPRIRRLLEDRSYSVAKAIEEAQRARAAAEDRAREVENKLASLAGEMRTLRADFEVQGKVEMQRLEKVAHETAARIAKDAEDTIGAESERARQVLRAEAAKLALALAEERIRHALTGDDDARLQKALVAGLGAGAQADRQPRA
jgi:F-type H+-transporting ATPase subunit b